MSDEAGRRLQALREAAGLSRRALARRAGTTPETISRWEAGVGPPRATTVHKLAAALGVRPEAILPEAAVPARTPGEAGLPAGLRAVLALRGIPPGPQGYDVAALAAAIEGLGWQCVAEERAPSQRGRHRYRALVFRRGEGDDPTHQSGRGRGETEAEALAAALVRLLEREA